MNSWEGDNLRQVAWVAIYLIINLIGEKVRRAVGLEKGLTAVEGIEAVSDLGEATKPKRRSLLAFPVRYASLFVITALKMFSGIREDGALSSALWLFACDKERVN
ncbi:hypothetical protein Tco_1492575 [Tanacetum coccineum]